MTKSRNSTKSPASSGKKQFHKGKGKPQFKKNAPTNDPTIWGIHAVAAALNNPEREIKSLLLTKNAASRIQESLNKALPNFEEASPKDIEQQIGPDPVHQGALLITTPLPTLAIEDLKGQERIVVLDQVSDPHNVGAILRSAAAFGISHLIMTQRHSPPLTGTLAKTACGGLEHVGIILVGNLAQTLNKLGERGFFRIGFDGLGQDTLEQFTMPATQPLALVLGAEEKGLRRLSKEQCDSICKITATGAFASLNVSNAAAIAFHHFQSPNDPNRKA